MGRDTTLVIIGAGVAGVSCIEALIQDFDQDEPQYKTIILISASRLVKKITNYQVSGRNLETFDVSEGDVDELVGQRLPIGLEFKSIVGIVKSIDYSEKTLIFQTTLDNFSYSKTSFDIVCLCNGSRPRHLSVKGRQDDREVDKRIFVIRDTSTVGEFKVKLADCRRLVIVGNGGISLELVSKISYCEKIWIVRDESIGYTFFDSGAGKFLLDSATTHGNKNVSSGKKTRTQIYSSTCQPIINDNAQFGPALGPNWLQERELSGRYQSEHKLDIIYQDEIDDIVYRKSQDFPLNVSTKKGKHIKCDLVISAIGVAPNKLGVTNGVLDVSEGDGGILIDEQMRTSLDKVYAAGDVVSCERWPPNELWFQMRLWTQARQMGFYAGRCIASHIRNQDPSIYFNFDCFAHCTAFFGYKLVLLGKYNGQLLNDKETKECEVIARVNPGKDYIKILIKDNRIIGAVLVGDSGLEETIENLICDRIDVREYKDQLLDETVDIEDYFD